MAPPQKARRKARKEKEGGETQPLTKRQELNNHIVCMRNTVAQARVQIINRLIHQIKKYRDRKGNPVEQEKAVRKADRLLEEIHRITKIKKDKVSLYALQASHDLVGILNNPKTSLEERVLARFSHQTLVQREVQKYRDANPNWDKQIPLLLAMTQEKRSNAKKNKDTVNNKQKPIKKVEEEKTVNSEATTSSESLSLSEIIKQLDEDERTVKIKREPGIKSEPSDSESSTVTKTNGEKHKDKRLKNGNGLQEEADSNSNPLKRLRKDSTDGKVKTPPKVVDKTAGTVTVKVLTDLSILERKEEEIPKQLQLPSSSDEVPRKKPKSSFFVGGVDEPEPNLPEPQKNQKETFQNKSFNQNFSRDRNGGGNTSTKAVYKKGKLISKAPSGPPHRGRGGGRGGGGWREVQAPQFNKPFKFEGRGGGRGSGRGGRGGGPDNRFSGNSEPLGKRKDFNSNSDKFLQAPKPTINPNSQKSSEPSNSSSAAEKLHPSWEAKKKQQSISLTAFQGKKIVFDD